MIAKITDSLKSLYETRPTHKRNWILDSNQ
jgi:hypothetical protein